MAVVPPAIIYVNDDISIQTQNRLVSQLHISQVMDGYCFDQRIACQPNFPAIVKSLNMRIMVTRNYRVKKNRNLADIVIYISFGLAMIEKNKFGPPRQTYPVNTLYWGQLGIFN